MWFMRRRRSRRVQTHAQVFLVVWSSCLQFERVLAYLQQILNCHRIQPLPSCWTNNFVSLMSSIYAEMSKTGDDSIVSYLHAAYSHANRCPKSTVYEVG